MEGGAQDGLGKINAVGCYRKPQGYSTPSQFLPYHSSYPPDNGRHVMVKIEKNSI